MSRVLAALCLTLAAVAFAPPATAAWDSSRLSTAVVVDGRTIPFPQFAIYLMPGHEFQVAFSNPSVHGTVRFAGRTTATGKATLTAPRGPGLSRLEVENTATGEIAVIHVFTLVRADRIDHRGRLNGYRIGQYPATPLRGLNIYRPPTGFVEVTANNVDTPVSPNFRLGQFVSKQEQDYPRYLVLRADLLLNLEEILAALNHSGRPTQALVVMSGYRTPWYNHAIGNVPYSRHTWGGAADLYIDEAPADGRMDDLDGNGRVDQADARWLAAFVNRLSTRGAFGPRIGGLGVYGSTPTHGPFIHVDVRGLQARW